MRTDISIDVAATPKVVFELAHRFTEWPTLLPHYRKVTVQSRSTTRIVATMSATRGFGPFGIPVWWRSEMWTDESNPADLQLRFRHIAGATKGMDVTWHIRPTRTGSRVTIEHDFRRPLLFIPADVFPAVVDRLFVRPIASRTLATFKSLAEASAPTSTALAA